MTRGQPVNRYFLITQSTFMSNLTVSDVNFAVACWVWRPEISSVCDVIVTSEKNRQWPPDFVAWLF
jgi:hypothetical protein